MYKRRLTMKPATGFLFSSDKQQRKWIWMLMNLNCISIPMAVSLEPIDKRRKEI